MGIVSYSIFNVKNAKKKKIENISFTNFRRLVGYHNEQNKR
jgi:hypothetical protein